MCFFFGIANLPINFVHNKYDILLLKCLCHISASTLHTASVPVFQNITEYISRVFTHAFNINKIYIEYTFQYKSESHTRDAGRRCSDDKISLFYDNAALRCCAVLCTLATYLFRVHYKYCRGDKCYIHHFAQKT